MTLLKDDDDELIGTDWIAEFIDVTRMAIFKWIKNPELNFPPPIIIDTGGKRMLKRWRKGDVKKWILTRAVQRVEKTEKKKVV